MRQTLPLIVAVLSFTGCDRGPADLAGPDTPPTPAANASGLYIKGPASMSSTRPSEYRGQSYPGALGYAWSVSGDGAATIDTRGNTRFVAATGQEPGPVTLRIYAYGADEVILAEGSRVVVVE